MIRSNRSVHPMFHIINWLTDVYKIQSWDNHRKYVALDEGNFIMMNFHDLYWDQILPWWPNKRGLVGWGTWQALERKEMPPARGQFGKRRLSCKNYIKMALAEISWDIGTALIFTRRGTRGGSLWERYRNFWFHISRRIVQKMQEF